MNKINIKQVMLNQLDIPNHKIAYVIHCREFVEGLWGCLKRYGIEFSKENHELLVDLVQAKLEHSEDIEREWSEEEYNNFVLYNE